jgi:hypothetical protein
MIGLLVFTHITYWDDLGLKYGKLDLKNILQAGA